MVVLDFDFGLEIEFCLGGQVCMVDKAPVDFVQSASDKQLKNVDARESKRANANGCAKSSS
jgi:hypothetical protein